MSFAENPQSVGKKKLEFISVEKQEEVVRSLGLSPEVARQNPDLLKMTLLNAMLGNHVPSETFDYTRRIARSMLHFLSGRD